MNGMACTVQDVNIHKYSATISEQINNFNFHVTFISTGESLLTKDLRENIIPYRSLASSSYKAKALITSLNWIMFQRC